MNVGGKFDPTLIGLLGAAVIYLGWKSKEGVRSLPIIRQVKPLNPSERDHPDRPPGPKCNNLYRRGPAAPVAKNILLWDQITAFSIGRSDGISNRNRSGKRFKPALMIRYKTRDASPCWVKPLQRKVQ